MNNTAAVMLEVVQGEGGIRPTDETFVKELAQLCNKKGILLIVDEIQTGIGRTGKKFGFEHYGIEPDIFTLAKGLGNGLPVGAMVAKEQYVDFLGQEHTVRRSVEIRSQWRPQKQYYLLCSLKHFYMKYKKKPTF